ESYRGSFKKPCKSGLFSCAALGVQHGCNTIGIVLGSATHRRQPVVDPLDNQTHLERNTPMASLQKSSDGIYRLAFRFPPGRGSRQFKRSLETSVAKEAKELKT